MKQTRKLLQVGILMSTLFVSAVPVAYAQTTEVEPQVVTTDDGSDWSWLGLLGLLGLAGLAGRKRREPKVKTYDDTPRR